MLTSQAHEINFMYCLKVPIAAKRYHDYGNSYKGKYLAEI